MNIKLKKILLCAFIPATILCLASTCISCVKGHPDGDLTKKKDLPDFEVHSESWAPLTYGYTSASVNLSTTFDPPSDYTGLITYSIKNQVGNWLIINDSTLTLKEGLGGGNYSYVIVAKASSDKNYNSKSKELSGNLSIGRASPSKLAVSVSAWDTTPTYGYTECPKAQLAYSGKPISGGVITYSIDQSDPEHNRFSIDNNSELKFWWGCGAGTYTCKVIGEISGDNNYNNGNLTTSQVSITVNKANPDSLSVVIGAWSLPNVTYGYTTQPIANLSLSGEPDGTGHVTYSLIGNDNASFYIINTNELRLKTNLEPGSYTAHVSAHIAGGSNFNSGDTPTATALTIFVGRADPADALTVSISSWSPSSSVTYGYTTRPEATLSLLHNATGTGNVTYLLDDADKTNFEITGTTLQLKSNIAVGSYTAHVFAHIAGGNNYKGGDTQKTTSAAITITKANTDILSINIGAWNPSSVTYGYTTQPTATLSLAGNPIGTGTITYVLDNADQTNFELTGTTLKLKTNLDPGSYTAHVSAQIAGGSNFNSGNIQQTTTTIRVNASPTWTDVTTDFIKDNSKFDFTGGFGAYKNDSIGLIEIDFQHTKPKDDANINWIFIEWSKSLYNVKSLFFQSINSGGASCPTAGENQCNLLLNDQSPNQNLSYIVQNTSEELCGSVFLNLKTTTAPDFNSYGIGSPLPVEINNGSLLSGSVSCTYFASCGMIHIVGNRLTPRHDFENGDYICHITLPMLSTFIIRSRVATNIHVYTPVTSLYKLTKFDSMTGMMEADCTNGNNAYMNWQEGDCMNFDTYYFLDVGIA